MRLDKRTRLLQRAIGYNRARDGKTTAPDNGSFVRSVWHKMAKGEVVGKPSKRWGFDGRGKVRKGHSVA